MARIVSHHKYQVRPVSVATAVCTAQIEVRAIATRLAADLRATDWRMMQPSSPPPLLCPRYTLNQAQSLTLTRSQDPAACPLPLTPLRDLGV